MLRSFAVKNFRAFEDIAVADCRRVNVLVGDNGSGKTALLEALFLAAGASPELAMRTRVWRGVEAGRVSGSLDDISRALFADMFYRFDTKRAAVITLRESKRENRTVTIRFHPKGQQRVEPPSRKKPKAKPRVIPESSPIEFEWKIGGQRVFTAHLQIQNGSLVFPSAPERIIQATFFASNRIAPNAEIVNRFSLLSRTFRDESFIRTFRNIYPTIVDLSVEVDTGEPMLFAKVEGLPEKIPLSLASGGMSKLASILLAMPSSPGGIVIVDEIENGVYYEKLNLMWSAIFEYANQFDCQVFASSHSGECLNALAPFAENSPQDVTILRTYTKNGDAQVLSYGGEVFKNAIKEEIEIR